MIGEPMTPKERAELLAKSQYGRGGRVGKKETPETALKRWSVNYLKWQGGDTEPLPAGPYGTSGMPDRMAWKGGKVIFLEFKIKPRKLSDVQVVMKDRMERQGLTYFVIYTPEEMRAALASLEGGESQPRLGELL